MRSYPFLIAGGYVLVGVTWILLSDKVSLLFSPDAHSLYGFEICKGAGYVLLTGLLLFFLMRNHEQKLRVALTKQEKANADLRLLLYKVNHDLRAPLTSIQGLLLLLKKENRGGDEYISKINTCTVTLQTLLQHLLETGKVMEGTFVRSEVSPETIKAEVSGFLQTYPDNENVRISWDIETQPVHTNAEAVQLIVQHLAENAIRYRSKEREQSTVEISIHPENDRLLIRVSDNGIGIAPEAQPHIFELFYRGETFGSGSGIGLFVVKKVMEQMNGAISVESERHVGTTFNVLLPLKG